MLEGLYRDMERRIASSPLGLCPVDMALNFLRLCHAQTCGKCVPCRIGLGQLAVLIEQVLDRTATLETIDLIERTARVIADSADCAIGFEAANMVLLGKVLADCPELGDGHMAEALQKVVSARKQNLLTVNETALQLGRDYQD